MKPNIVKIQTFFKNYSGYIFGILCLLFVFTCNSGAKDHLADIAKREQENKTSEKTKDSLYDVIRKRDKVIAANDKAMAQNQKDKAKLEKQLVAEKAKGQKLIAKAKNYNLKDWKDFYQEKTGYGDADIYIDGNALKITREPLIAIGTDLIKKDVVQAELKIVSQVLVETKDDLLLMTSNYNQEQEKNSLLELSAKEDAQIKENLNKNVADLKTDLKKAKRPKLVPIIIGAAAGVVGGILIAK